MQVLGQRWLFLPLACLWVGGSLSVTVGLAGAFIFWSLLVLVADAAAIAIAAEQPTLATLRAAAAATAAVPAVGALVCAFCDFHCVFLSVCRSLFSACFALQVLSRSPMFGAQLGVVGMAYAAITLGAAIRSFTAETNAPEKLAKVRSCPAQFRSFPAHLGPLIALLSACSRSFSLVYRS